MEIYNVSMKDHVYSFAAEGGSVCFTVADELFKGIDLKHGRYINFCLENKESIVEIVNLCVWTKCTEEPQLRITMGIFPGIKTPVSIPIEVLKGNVLYLKRVAPVFKRTVKGHGVTPEDIIKIGFAMGPGDRCRSVSITDIHTSDIESGVSCQENLVDEFGQYAAGEWYGKTKNEAELTERLRSYLESAHEHKADLGDSYFKVVYENGRYVFADTNGKRMFLSGIDCIIPSEKSVITGFEGCYRELPDEQFCETELREKNRGCKTASFIMSNLSKAFGKDGLKENWMKIANDRINRLGFNSIGAWSDQDFIRYSNLPYMLVLNDFPTTEEKVFRDFPDVFSPEYSEAAQRYAQQLKEYRDDKRLIGYFMRNEPHWAFVDEFNLGAELIKNEGCGYTKAELIKWLKNRYETVDVLNGELNTSFKRYEDIFMPGTDMGDAFNAVLFAFTKVMVEQYIKIPAEELKKVDENHLNLGMRYAYISSEALYAGAEYFDVFSINCYNYSCVYDVEKIYKNTGKPVIIGEYHFGALDRGLPSTGIKGVTSQEERGKAVRYYIEQSAACPYCVGVQYFQFNDQGIMGRPDGENYQIGIHDVCMKPYEEISEGFRTAHDNLDGIINRIKQPTQEMPETIPAIF